MNKKKNRSPGTLRTSRTTAVRRADPLGEAKAKPFTARELRRISAEISARGLPSFETTRFELLDIDPWNVHASWHIAPEDMAAARAKLPRDARNAALVLRFSDVSPRSLDPEGPHRRFDIEVPEDSDNRYVNLWRDAKHYSAAIGLRAADGAFVPLARSNEIATPRGGPAPELDFQQIEVRAHDAPPAHRTAVSAVPSAALLRNLLPQRTPPRDEFPQVIAEPVVRAHEEPAFPDLEAPQQEAPETEIAGIADRHDATPAGITADVPGNGSPPTGAAVFPLIPADQIDRYHLLAQTALSQARSAEKLPPLPPADVAAVAPTDVALVSQPLPIPSVPAVDTVVDVDVDSDVAAVPPIEVVPPASLGAGTETAAAESERAPTHVALESLLGKTVFSFGAAADSAADASVHVVIEGRGLPDTVLSLFGAPVPQNPDGSFALRLSLERGPALVALLRQLSLHRIEE